VRLSKEGKTVYVEAGIWLNEKSGHIHIAIPKTDWFHSTVSGDPQSKRSHPNLFKKLSRLLKEAGAPYPAVSELAAEQVDEADETN
jgi:hypothetical protein